MNLTCVDMLVNMHVMLSYKLDMLVSVEVLILNYKLNMLASMQAMLVNMQVQLDNKLQKLDYKLDMLVSMQVKWESMKAREVQAKLDYMLVK